jgi:hypothetical protein
MVAQGRVELPSLGYDPNILLLDYRAICCHRTAFLLKMNLANKGQSATTAANRPYGGVMKNSFIIPLSL